MQQTKEDLNKKCFQTLNDLNMKDYVAVIGSGPSSPYSTDVNELKKILVKECSIDEIPNEYLWDTAQRAFDKNNDTYYKVIIDNYSKRSEKFAPVYHWILKLPFAGFVTFNYDRQIPDIVFLQNTGQFTVYPPRKIKKIVNGEEKVVDEFAYSAPEDFINNKKPVPILAIHGCFDERNPDWYREVILKASDYDAHYAIPSPYPLYNWWKTLLSMKNCIFIGTSLREPGLARVVERIKKENTNGLPPLNHYHLRDVKQNNGSYPIPKKTLGHFNELFYDPLDDEYTGLIKIFRQLVELRIEVTELDDLGPKKIQNNNPNL